MSIKNTVIILFIITGTLFLVFFTEDTSEQKQYEQEFFNEYNTFAVPMPEKLSLAGEEVPLSDPDVFERIDRELLVNTYWQSNGVLMFKRAHKFFPIIEPILKKNGVPDDFKYLSVIESGLTNVVSPSGAAGFWQFMAKTGEEYDLEVNAQVDERYHLEKATEAACVYLKQAKEKFGSWSLAAASYNMGMNGLQRQMNRQKADNYYDLLLNSETSRYVMRIIALKEIMTHPKKYGYDLRAKDFYEYGTTDEVKIDSAVADFADFAKQYNISYKTFKNYNPWLRQTYLHNKSGKTYTFKIPQKD